MKKRYKWQISEAEHISKGKFIRVKQANSPASHTWLYFVIDTWNSHVEAVGTSSGPRNARFEAERLAHKFNEKFNQQLEDTPDIDEWP